MSGYIKCQEREFVLLAGDSMTLQPKRRGSCPNCKGNNFQFTNKDTL